MNIVTQKNNFRQSVAPVRSEILFLQPFVFLESPESPFIISANNTTAQVIPYRKISEETSFPHPDFLKEILLKNTVKLLLIIVGLYR